MATLEIPAGASLDLHVTAPGLGSEYQSGLTTLWPAGRATSLS